MKKVLALSGGGIRGILTARILLQIEQQAGKPIHELFDFFAGTSTGGILTALILTGKYSMQDCIDLYVKNGSVIFSKNEWDIDGLLGAKYTSSGIEGLLKQYFGDMLAAELIKPCIIPSYNTATRSARFFAQTDNDETKVWEACRATSAAPTFFPSFGDFIDGGVICNAPGLCALSELGTTEDVVLLSIGTGSKELPYHTHDWGLVKWIEPVIDVLMSGQEELCDFHLRKLLGDRYICFQPDLNGVSEEMDNVTPENIKALLRKPLSFNIDNLLNKIAG